LSDKLQFVVAGFDKLKFVGHQPHKLLSSSILNHRKSSGPFFIRHATQIEFATISAAYSSTALLVNKKNTRRNGRESKGTGN
jgi:hypothetical protein